MRGTQMEQFDEYIAEPVGSFGIAADESAEPADGDFQEAELPARDTVYTDDPVRQYLREMGSVRLLTRQGEIESMRNIRR